MAAASRVPRPGTQHQCQLTKATRPWVQCDTGAVSKPGASLQGSSQSPWGWCLVLLWGYGLTAGATQHPTQSPPAPQLPPTLEDAAQRCLCSKQSGYPSPLSLFLLYSQACSLLLSLSHLPLPPLDPLSQLFSKVSPDPFISKHNNQVYVQVTCLSCYLHVSPLKIYLEINTEQSH